MQEFFILCIAIVVCYARPDVSHITNNEYLPPEQISSKHYAASNESSLQVQKTRERLPLIHAQVESIQPSIHIASFTIRTIVPLEKSYTQTQQTQSIEAPIQQSHFSSEGNQTLPFPTESSYNNNAPLTYQQNSVQESYTPPVNSFFQMPDTFLQPTPEQQHYTQQTPQPPYVPSASIEKAPNANQQTPTSSQKSFTSTERIQQFYSPSVASYAYPAPTQQAEVLQPAQKTQLAKIQQIFSSPAQNLAPTTSAQQGYTLVQQQPSKSAEPRQQVERPSSVKQTYSYSAPAQRAESQPRPQQIISSLEYALNPTQSYPQQSYSSVQKQSYRLAKAIQQVEHKPSVQQSNSPPKPAQHSEIQPHSQQIFPSLEYTLNPTQNYPQQNYLAVQQHSQPAELLQQIERQPSIPQTYSPPVPAQHAEIQPHVQRTFPPIQVEYTSTPTTSAEQSYSAAQQSYKTAKTLQQIERQPSGSQTYYPTIRTQIAEVQPRAQQSSTTAAQTFTPTASHHQGYSAAQQPLYTPIEPLQQSFLSALPPADNTRQVELKKFAQQTYSPPASSYQYFTPPVPVQQSYVPQQSIPQPFEARYASSNFNSARVSEAYLPPAAFPQSQNLKQTNALPPAYQEASNQQNFTPLQNLQQNVYTQAPLSTQKNYISPPPLQQVFTPHDSSQQSYWSSPSTHSQQSYSTASTYLPSSQTKQIIQQFQSPSRTVQLTLSSNNETNLVKKAPVEQSAGSSSLYNRSIMQVNGQHFIATKTPNLVHSGSTTKIFRSPIEGTLNSATSVSDTDSSPVNLSKTNTAQLPQQRPTEDSTTNRAYNYIQQSRSHSYEIPSSASGTASYMQNQPRETPATDIGTNKRAESPQKFDQTTELYSPTVSTTQQVPKLSSSTVSAYTYQPSADSASSPVQMFNFIPKLWNHKFDYRTDDVQLNSKSTGIQPINISTNQGASKSSESIPIAEQSTQKTELPTNPNAGTEYASDGGYIYRKS